MIYMNYQAGRWRVLGDEIPADIPVSFELYLPLRASLCGI